MPIYDGHTLSVYDGPPGAPFHKEGPPGPRAVTRLGEKSPCQSGAR